MNYYNIVLGGVWKALYALVLAFFIHHGPAQVENAIACQTVYDHYSKVSDDGCYDICETLARHCKEAKFQVDLVSCGYPQEIENACAITLHTEF
jgi:hypothetical protein